MFSRWTGSSVEMSSCVRQDEPQNTVMRRVPVGSAPLFPRLQGGMADFSGLLDMPVRFRPDPGISGKSCSSFWIRTLRTLEAKHGLTL